MVVNINQLARVAYNADNNDVTFLEIIRLGATEWLILNEAVMMND